MAYSVGGVSFDLKVNLKTFEKQLDKAFSIAKKKGAGLVWDTSSFVAGLKMTKKEFESFSKEVSKARDRYEELLDLQKGLQSSDLWGKMGDQARSAVEEAVSAAKEEAQIYDRTIKHMGRAQRLKSIFGGLGKVFGGLFSVFRRNTAKAGSEFSGFLKKLVGITGVAVLLRKAFSFAREGMNNLVQADANTANSVNMLRGALTALKNALASAFAPILNVIAPILTKFINMLVTAANAVASFISALTGKKFAVVATGVADGISGIGDSASGANDSAKELQRTLMGFDKINKLDSTSGGGGGGGGGSGGGGAGGGGFDVVPISDEVNQWAEKFKESWENADFEWLGALVAQKLNNALKKIPWDDIKATSAKIAKSIATFLNGFFGEEDLWTTVGKTLAEALNTVIEFGYSFVTNFNWKKFGTAISNAINGFFSNIDTSKAGQAISGAIKGVLDTINTVLTETDWEQVGKKVGELLANIDWIGVAKKIGEAIVNAFKAIAGVFEGIGTAILQGVQDWLAKKGIKVDLVGNVNKTEIDPKLNPEIRTKAKFTSKEDALTKDQRTINAKAKYVAKQDALSKDQKTIGAKAKFTSRQDALGKDLKTFSSKANFTSRLDGLTTEQKTFNCVARITSAIVKGGRTVEDLVPHVASGGIFKNGKKYPIQRYDAGGLPNGSQLFWARESGPELVGTLGGHTAVMNNDQIVASVSSGVAKAIAGIRFKMSAPPLAVTSRDQADAMRNQDSDNREVVSLLTQILKALNAKDFDVHLDGESIKENTVRRINNHTRATGKLEIIM